MAPRSPQEWPKSAPRLPNVPQKPSSECPKSIPRECLRDLSGCFGASRFRLCRIRFREAPCAVFEVFWTLVIYEYEL